MLNDCKLSVSRVWQLTSTQNNAQAQIINFKVDCNQNNAQAQIIKLIVASSVAIHYKSFDEAINGSSVNLIACIPSKSFPCVPSVFILTSFDIISNTKERV